MQHVSTTVSYLMTGLCSSGGRQHDLSFPFDSLMRFAHYHDLTSGDVSFSLQVVSGWACESSRGSPGALEQIVKEGHGRHLGFMTAWGWIESIPRSHVHSDTNSTSKRASRYP